MRGGVTPIRSDCADQYPITWFEKLDVAAYFVHDANSFMSKCQVLSWANRAIHRMRVRGTNQGPGRFDNGIVWTGLGDCFLHEPHLPYRFHHKGFHAVSSLCFTKKSVNAL